MPKIAVTVSEEARASRRRPGPKDKTAEDLTGRLREALDQQPHQLFLGLPDGGRTLMNASQIGRRSTGEGCLSRVEDPRQAIPLALAAPARRSEAQSGISDILKQGAHGEERMP
jgi:hypothetical protein